jgi:hypothetical protein
MDSADLVMGIFTGSGITNWGVLRIFFITREYVKHSQNPYFLTPDNGKFSH